MDWQSCKTAFADDGFSRHIQADGLTLSGWNRCYRVLRASDAVLHLHRDGEPQPLPERFDVTPFASSHRYLLSLDLAGVLLTHHHWDHVGGVEPLIEEFVSSQGGIPSPAAVLDEETRARLRKACHGERALVLACGERSIRLRPALNVTAEEIAEGLLRIRAGLRKVRPAATASA
mgnify:CR=1 FL=1